MRIIVTGWRAAGEAHREIVGGALPWAWDVGPGARDMTLVHGDGTGVDQLAADIADRWGWTVEAHPADWEHCGDGCPPRPHLRMRGATPYCPHAGPRRNEAMCAAGADLVLAFPGPNSTGTWDCLRRAQRHGIAFRGYPLQPATRKAVGGT